MDLDTLAAVSGDSALFAYQPQTFMPEYANLHIGTENRIASATGFRYEWVPIEGPDDAWQVLRESLDSGRPINRWHYENLLLSGYQDTARKEDRQVFVMAEGPTLVRSGGLASNPPTGSRNGATAVWAATRSVSRKWRERRSRCR